MAPRGVSRLAAADAVAMDTREGFRIIATVIGGGLLAYAGLAIVRGVFHDVEDGRVDRSARPINFWLLVVGMTLLGLTILGVGWDWPLVHTAAAWLGGTR